MTLLLICVSIPALVLFAWYFGPVFGDDDESES